MKDRGDLLTDPTQQDRRRVGPEEADRGTALSSALVLLWSSTGDLLRLAGSSWEN